MPPLTFSFRLQSCFGYGVFRRLLTAIVVAFGLWHSAFAAEVSVSAEVGQMQYNMVETGATGLLLDREDGSIPIQRLSLNLNLSPYSLEFSAWQGNNQISYIGSTQFGFPVFTQTLLKTSGSQIRFGRSWPVFENSVVSLSTGLDAVQLDRTILPAPFSAPLQENLASIRALFGVEYMAEPAIAFNRPFILTLGLDFMRAIHQTIQINSFGMYDPIVLNPTPGGDWRAKIKLEWRPLENSRIWVAMEREEFNPGSTPFQVWNQGGTPATMVRFPGSQQTMRKIFTGVSWKF